MLFNSIDYIIFFLPLTFLVYLALSHAANNEKQVIWLVIASLFFYASWEPTYLLLIVFSISVNFLISKRLINDKPATVRLWLVIGVSYNLALLGYFKYTGFFVNGLNELGLWLIPAPEITLPLAISFFTFQQIAYLVDVSRKECQEYEFLHYALFVLFFPQLIAGPIVHHKEMMPQFLHLRPKEKLPSDLAIGITFIAIGLFKKIILADSLALVVDPVFDSAASGATLNSVDALAGMAAFSFQIYFDFSGYSDIAIGSARLFGIRLPENFRSPYKSRSIIDIWRRWHMTLSRFLRDYLYFSLGGNKHGVTRRYRNLLLTMLLGGLWHGAAWTFVIWGGLHGLYLCINHAWRALVARTGSKVFFDHWSFQPMFVLMTFIAWSVAMAFFRAADSTAAWSIISSGFLAASTESPALLGNALSNTFIFKLMVIAKNPIAAYYPVYTLLLIAAIVCWLLPNTQEFIGRNAVIEADKAPEKSVFIRWRPTAIFAILNAFLLSVSLLSLSSISRFIYFQF
jgi:alginate O-acetyltransferase complex protein AlgI